VRPAGKAAEGKRKKDLYGRESVNDHLSGMQGERFHRLSGMPRAGKAAQQYGAAASVHELSREGDQRLSPVPGGEEGGRGEIGAGDYHDEH
jgi:hypothetical protein